MHKTKQQQHTIRKKNNNTKETKKNATTPPPLSMKTPTKKSPNTKQKYEKTSIVFLR